MNNKFDKKYKQLLLEQRIISNVNLITQWNWSDFLNKAKSFVGLGPSEAQQAAKAAEEAAKQDPSGKIHKLSIKITDEELKQAEQIISKNKTLLDQYNAIEKIEDKKAFMLGLLQQAKTAAAEKAANTFDPEKLDEKTKQLYELCVTLHDKESADKVWLKAVKQKKVICIGEGGKLVAVAKSKFQAKADRYLEKSKANMPTDEFEKESVEEIIAKEENKDDLTKMLDIYVSAVGDEKKAKDDFAKYLSKGKIAIFKDGKTEKTTKAKFKENSEKYIKMAQKYNPNEGGDIDDSEKNDDKNKLIKECRKFWADLPTTDLMNLCAQSAADYRDQHEKENPWWTPKQYILWDLDGKKISQWGNHWHINSKVFPDRTAELIKFINGDERWKDEKQMPAHPQSLYDILQGIVNDTNSDGLKQILNDKCKNWLDKANKLAEKCKEAFPLSENSKM